MYVYRLGAFTIHINKHCALFMHKTVEREYAILM